MDFERNCVVKLVDSPMFKDGDSKLTFQEGSLWLFQEQYSSHSEVFGGERIVADIVPANGVLPLVLTVPIQAIKRID